MAVGASGAVGVDARLLHRLHAFVEFQGSVVHASFDLPDRTITPRFVNLYGLTGLRLGF